ncbi:hypothetical protein Y032_0141g2210 [Ancylostoma ceylanicum]|uniref:Uncharacterized protein n=1 Tax=Ancylostoma ceylanicum TaxID=53326 RepID=A0A016T3M5_9BILA|nr:hypothetical protein Y032_0141g2210 [Ancylostoma ceylanicum]
MFILTPLQFQVTHACSGADKLNVIQYLSSTLYASRHPSLYLSLQLYFMFHKAWKILTREANEAEPGDSNKTSIFRSTRVMLMYVYYFSSPDALRRAGRKFHYSTARSFGGLGFIEL